MIGPLPKSRVKRKDRVERNEGRYAVQPCSKVLPHRFSALLANLQVKQVTAVLPFHHLETIDRKAMSKKVGRGTAEARSPNLLLRYMSVLAVIDDGPLCNGYLVSPLVCNI